MNELTPYQRWQLEKYGDILPEEEVVIIDFCPRLDNYSNAERNYIFKNENPE
jgi:hypothetical protein